MSRFDPAIDVKSARQARRFQLMFPVIFRLFYSSKKSQFATKEIAKPERIVIPTRHGQIPALLYSPTAADVAAQLREGRRPPVHLITHGGAFIIRVPQQEDNVARYVASEVGAFVVIPDYDTAPTVRFPVSEEQCFDAFTWIRENGSSHGWDVDRISVGGPSAGGKFSINVALMAIDAGQGVPVAVTSEYGCVDLTMDDSLRTSPKSRPVVAPDLFALVRRTYFADADVADPLASPALHPRIGEMPPTLILTAEYDTLRHEMHAFADRLSEREVEVTTHEFAGVDHGFTHAKPFDVVGESLRMIGDHLRAAYSRTGDEDSA